MSHSPRDVGGGGAGDRDWAIKLTVFLCKLTPLHSAVDVVVAAEGLLRPGHHRIFIFKLI